MNRRIRQRSQGRGETATRREDRSAADRDIREYFEEEFYARTRPMWVALDKKKNRIAATWYRGCVRPFNSWRIAVRSRGYHPHKVTVVGLGMTVSPTQYAKIRVLADSLIASCDGSMGQTMLIRFRHTEARS